MTVKATHSEFYKDLDTEAWNVYTQVWNADGSVSFYVNDELTASCSAEEYEAMKEENGY